MSSYDQGKKQRKDWEMALPLLLLLIAGLAGTGRFEDGDSSASEPFPENEDSADDSLDDEIASDSNGTTITRANILQSTRAVVEDDGKNSSSRKENEEPVDDASPPYPIIVPAALLLLITIIVIIVLGVIYSKRKKNKNVGYEKEDGHLTGGEIPSPMFEDDVPSVLELEMEDLEKWMIKKDSGGEVLEPGKET
ncbi:transmembrane protein 154 [Lepisosteus oculatus]|uniref:transmembrane protein 154 n=1 Tax=Lepisosteus oculatus TaxID=7918 RepID=UPI0035F508BD